MRLALRAALVLAVLAACGSSPARDPGPLVPAAELAIVAAAGDDLAFLQPELYDAVQRGAGVTVVYVTAPGTTSADLADRTDGARAAYAAIAGSDDWACGPLALGATTVAHCRLDAARLSLVFLDYPAGGPDGAAPTSLLNLWEANITSAMSLAAPPSRLSQPELIRVVAQIIDATAPTTLRTLEIAATHGPDASDRMLAGALALLATAASGSDPALIAYRGDNIAGEPANVEPALATRAADPLGRYAACTTGCAPCGDACPAGADAQALLARHYPVAMRTGAGLLRQDASCVTVTTEGANGSMVDCAAAPTWTLDAHGRLRASTGLCLRAILTGEIIATACGDDGPGGRFFLDADGHLWSGEPPAPADDMRFAHLDCLVVAGGRPRAALCGQPRAPVWTLAP
jgi:hypothetical protein